MLSWRREAGNKGWVMNENFRALLQMILAKGFLTNPDVPGVEMPVCCRHHPKLVKIEDVYQPDMEDGVLPANSISMVKGWSRACAMHLVLKLCVEVQVFDQYMAYLGDRAEGFKTIHGNLQLCIGDADPMDVNRGVNADHRLKLAKIGTTHGMVKGPFSHQSIGCKAMRIGFCNNFEDPWWAAHMASDAETITMIIDRLHADWKELPSGLRWTADEMVVMGMQKKARCFQLLLGDLKERIPAEAFASENQKLQQAWAMGTLDSQLCIEVENQHPLDCSRLHEFQRILEAIAMDVTMAAAKKRAELAKSLETATFMSLCEDLKVDKEKVAHYIQGLSAARVNWQGVVASYKRMRRSKGLRQSAEFMKVNIDVDKLADDENLADMSKHFNVFKAEALVILDLSLAPSLTMMAQMIQTACAMCQQSPKIACLVRYPWRTPSQPEGVWLGNVRKIEDKLIAGGLCISNALCALMDTSDCHGNDRRDAIVQFRLCFSTSFETNNCWIQSNAMNDHKIIRDVHMVAGRDLRKIPQSDTVLQKEHLNLVERGSQLGVQAIQKILSSLINGRAGGDTRARKVVVMDINPTFGDYMDASFNLLRVHQTGGEQPRLSYICRYLASQVSECGGMRARMQQTLMEQWWEGSELAGPAEPVSGIEVSRPDLRLMSWSNDGSKVTLPQMIVDKFGPDSEYYEQWKELLAGANEVLDKLQASNTHCNGGTVAQESSGPVQLTGPDLDGAELPDWNRELHLEETPLSEFSMDTVLLGLKVK
eukprot:Skav234295  [mRNA]  locus=scaffold2271:198567:201667:+ [translate_table: standard]